jgi:hypothetical protein
MQGRKRRASIYYSSMLPRSPPPCLENTICAHIHEERAEPKSFGFEFVFDPAFSIQGGKLPGYHCAWAAIRKAGLEFRHCSPTLKGDSSRRGKKTCSGQVDARWLERRNKFKRGVAYFSSLQSLGAAQAVTQWVRWKTDKMMLVAHS